MTSTWNWPRSFVALDREVPRWDQPLLSDFHAVDVVMVCQRRGGVLHFLLRHAVEIGFRDGVQFGPSLQLTATKHLRDPFQRSLVELIEEGIVHADVWASDEGGRFDHNRVRYRIVQLPDGLEWPGGLVGDAVADTQASEDFRRIDQ